MARQFLRPDLPTFADYAAATTRRNVVVMLALVAGGIIAWWPTDRWVFGHDAALVAAFSQWRTAMLTVALTAVLYLWFAARRGWTPWPGYVTAIVGFSALNGWVLAKAGAPDTPWIHSQYVLAPISLMFIVRPLVRGIVIALFVTACLGAYFAFDSSYLHKTGAAFLLSFMTFASLLSLAGGHLLYRLLERDFSRGQALAANNRHLERLVGEQTESLFRLAAGVQETRENDRSQIAKDIHDDQGQYLTALRIHLDWLKNQPSATPERLASFVQTTSHLLEQLNATQRKIIERLEPYDNRLGLATALEILAENWSQDTGIPCQTQISAAANRLPPPLAAPLYRIAGEALTNIAKHAAASRAELSLNNNGNLWRLAISDNGRGLSQQGSGGYGLLNMQARAQALGSALQFKTPADGGCCISLEFSA